MVKPVNFTDQLKFSDHLIELRDRFVIVTLVIFGFFAFWFYYVDILVLWLEQPLPPQFKNLTFITPTEPFFTTMKVALMGALFTSMPLILYHLWEFMAPGLKIKERKITLMFVVFGTFFFTLGGAFCYFIVMPLGLRYLLTYGSNYWKMQVTIGLYYDFVVKLMLGFAFAFQTPLIMVLLTKFGVVSTVKMRLYRKWAFLGCFVVGAILTPPDVITQTLMSLPLYGLYEFGVVVSRVFEDPKNREAAIRQILAEKKVRIERRAAEEAAREAAARRPKTQPKQKTPA